MSKKNSIWLSEEKHFPIQHLFKASAYCKALATRCLVRSFVQCESKSIFVCVSHKTNLPRLPLPFRDVKCVCGTTPESVGASEGWLRSS